MPLRIGIAEVMSPEVAQRVLLTLARGYSGRLATVSEDGFPYCIPLLYLWMNGEVYLHTTSAGGYLRANIDRERRVCFQIDEEQGVFDYGRFECDLDRPIAAFACSAGSESSKTGTSSRGSAKRRWQNTASRRSTSEGLLPADRYHHRACGCCRAHDRQRTGTAALFRAMACEGQDETPNASLRADGVKSSEETGPANS